MNFTRNYVHLVIRYKFSTCVRICLRTQDYHIHVIIQCTVQLEYVKPVICFLCRKHTIWVYMSAAHLFPSSRCH